MLFYFGDTCPAANTYLMYEYLPGVTSSMMKRVRVTIAGAIIAAIADLLLLLLIGFHDDTTTAKERGEGEAHWWRNPVGGYNVNATGAYTTTGHNVPVTHNSVPVSHTTAPTVPVNTAV
jgi:hypothetical protein